MRSAHSSSVQFKPANRADSRTISSVTGFVPGCIWAHSTPGSRVEPAPADVSRARNARRSGVMFASCGACYSE